MAGIDLDPAAVDYCKAHSPEIRVHAGSAHDIPESDAAFDLTIAFTLFSSVHDDTISAQIASEMLRITRPGGLLIVYDMRRRNPRNKAVHPVSESEIRRWFPGCKLRTKSITLAPPLARPAGERAPWLYGPLAKLPPLRTHAMYVLRKSPV
jgi:SAM-dependent methyltransferase